MIARQLAPVLARIFAGALAFASICAPALGQETKEAKNKPFRLQTALDLPPWLKVSGSLRPRYETLANQFNAGRTGDDELLSWQVLLKAEIDTGPIIIGGELLDSRRFIGNAGGGAPAEVNTLEPMQLYLAWRPKDFLLKGADLDLTLGRFAMDVGSRRLVARSNYRNISTEFDGARAVWTAPGEIKATAFYSAVANRLPSDISSALDNEVVLDSGDNVRFGGWSVEGPLPFSTIGEVYLYDLDEDDAAGFATRNRDLSTVGIRARRAPKDGQFDFEVEYVRQTGTTRATTSAADLTDLDHKASFLHAEAGFTFAAPWSPRLIAQVDHATGDKSPTDGRDERFDTLFGDRAFEFGPTGIYGAVARTNLNAFGLRLEVKPDKPSDAYVSLKQVKLDQPRDSFGNSGVRDTTGASGDDVATQIEGRYRRWLIPDSVRLSIGAAALIRDDFLKTAPNATRQGDSYYGFTEIAFSF